MLEGLFKTEGSDVEFDQKNYYSQDISELYFKLSWTIIFNLPVITLIKQPIEEYFCFSEDREEEKPEYSNLTNKPP